MDSIRYDLETFICDAYVLGVNRAIRLLSAFEFAIFIDVGGKE